MATPTAASDAPLAIEGVSVAYGNIQALSTVTLHLDTGVTALLGPNGAGKTTLFRVGAGVLQPDTGTVRIAGRDPFTEPASKADVEPVIESVTYEATGCGKCVQHNRNPARCGFGRRLLECRGYRDSTAVRAP
ncbi:ABC-type multidrug transport system, ATPase component [Halapricum desulfuricans]|uniref:ABC-type multidrug transport system, ATPase component n=1 Tax=Halapricum desulfuricans TaxID=2841257 RepID=A0A897NIU1_9EURY|nr:ABC-type multidrug transport system, ATPase component [Halapricum desulfuricans]